MSRIICGHGPDGGFVHVIDENAERYADAVRMKWAQVYRMNHGEYPGMEDQMRAWEMAYDRFIQGDADEWDWADERAWAILTELAERSEVPIEPTRDDRLYLAEQLRAIKSEQ